MAELAELWYASSRLQAENETQGARWAPPTQAHLRAAPGPTAPQCQPEWAHIPLAVATEMTGGGMLGLVLLADPPPGSAQTQRMLAVTLVLVVGWQHPGRRSGRLTGNAGAGPQYGRPRPRQGPAGASRLTTRGGRVQSGHWHRDFDLVLVLVKLPKVFFETPTGPTKRLPLVGGRKTRPRMSGSV